MQFLDFARVKASVPGFSVAGIGPQTEKIFPVDIFARSDDFAVIPQIASFYADMLALGGTDTPPHKEQVPFFDIEKHIVEF